MSISRVLLIEPDQTWQEILSRRLLPLDVVADACTDAGGAMTRADGRIHQAIIMEMDLDGSYALELAKRLRQVPGFHSTPMIALTKRQDLWLAQQCLNLSFSAYMVKAKSNLHQITACIHFWANRN